MKLGFLTVALGQLPCEEILDWAAKTGFEALELAAWPRSNDRDFSSSTIDANMSPQEAKDLRAKFDDRGVEISSLAYYDNMLAADSGVRAANQDHLKKVIDTASAMGVELVGTFVGRDITKSVDENLDEFAKVFPQLISYAESKNVKLMIENCPMDGWQEPGVPGNLFYSPSIWRELFRITPDSFGLNYDPSHMYWMGIDHIAGVLEFADRIFHAHAKDAEFLGEGMYDNGIFGVISQRLSREPWWQYRLPGLGEIDWQEFIKALYDVGYDGVLSIEHEDPVWGGSVEKSKKGLILGYRNLAKLLV
jgi:sugar phosphate isomerase/epimerase